MDEPCTHCIFIFLLIACCFFTLLELSTKRVAFQEQVQPIQRSFSFAFNFIFSSPTPLLFCVLVFFDIDEVATLLTVGGQPMPHMRPSLSQFSQALTAAGIGRDDVVVLYDASSIFNASARAWWTFMVTH